MKKLLSVLLILTCLSACFAASAESPDLSGYSFYELIGLRQQIDQAIREKAVSADRSDYSLDGLIYVSNGSEIRINTYEGTASELVILGMIDGLPVTRLQANAFKNNQQLTSVVLPDSITVIPEETFSGCTNLTSVILPAGLTEIGRWAFIDTKVKSLALPEGLTTLAPAAFQRAEGLEGVIVLPSTLKSSPDGYGYTFSRCDKLTGVVVQSGLTFQNGDFACSSLEFVYIRENCPVSFEGEPFEGDSLKVVIIPAAVTSIGEKVFDKCSKLTIVCPAGSYAESYAREHFLVCNTADYEKYVEEYDKNYLP